MEIDEIVPGDRADLMTTQRLIEEYVMERAHGEVMGARSITSTDTLAARRFAAVQEELAKRFLSSWISSS